MMSKLSNPLIQPSETTSDMNEYGLDPCEVCIYGCAWSCFFIGISLSLLLYIWVVFVKKMK